MDNLTLHDHQPVLASLHDAVVRGLSRRPKEIAPKFFYDDRGSRLFDRICEQPEYYPPAVERRMLAELADEVAAQVGTGRVLIEPGAGSAAKVRLILDALRPSAFVPMDICFEHLKASVTDLARAYPWLLVHATCVDFSRDLRMPDAAPDGPRLLFFPGSSLGNFDHADARRFLERVRATVGPDGMVLIGVDTKKDEAVLNAAYNDAAGVTAEFNLNLLHRMRDELDMDVDPDTFEHQAFYNADAGRVEMHLVSQVDQTLRVNGHRFDFAAGESLHTENSYKYTPEEFLALAAGSGLRPVQHWLDDDDLFAIYLLAAA